MKRNIIFMVLMILLCAIYTNGMNFIDSYIGKGSKPSIQINGDVIEISVHDAETVLFQGVSASDKEDGDITSNVIVESISSFDERNERTINYAVFDNDNNVSRMIRKLKYTDYSVPTFSIEKAIILNDYFYDSELTSYVSAYSSIDGDISSNIKVKNLIQGENGEKGSITYEVSDSCGKKVEYTLDVTYLVNPLLNTIELSTYHEHLPVGIAYFNPRSYITNIEGPLGNLTKYVNQVNIIDNVNYQVPGTYEIMYTLTSDDGSFGATKLLVTIE